MRTAGYAAGRVVLFGSGWALAALLAYAAEEMMAGTKWPIFGVFSAWWTYACALFICVEAHRSAGPDAGANALTGPDAAVPALSSRHIHPQA